MAYPLIILGAGASFDSLQRSEITQNELSKCDPYRPPLANDLFRRKYWDNYIKRWDEISDLATDLVGSIPSYGGIEPYLTHLLTEIAPKNEKRAKQILASRFYLATLFKDISANYYSKGNNYHALLQAIEDRSGNKAIFVNFNYDHLLEKNIPDINEAKHIDKFISGDIKVIKIHGSCHWVHEPIKQQSFLALNDNPSSYIYYVVNAKNYINNLQLPLSMNVIHDDWDFTYRFNDVIVSYYLPAISVPLNNKKDYICPDSHTTLLKESLSRIDRILMIGWSANDDYLVKELNNYSFNKKIPIYIVTNSESTAAQVAQRFNNNIFDLYPCKSEGFSNFLQSKEYINFWHEPI